MTDNHDGTYTYNYTVSRPGQITVSVLHYTHGGVYAEYFPNQSESGNNAYNLTYPQQINYPSSTNDAYPARATNVSANFYFRFQAPITGAITFTIDIGKIILSDIFSKIRIDSNCFDFKVLRILMQNIILNEIVNIILLVILLISL